MKLLEKDNAVLIPRACLGLAIGAFNVILKPAIQDLGAKALSKLDINIPTEEELNTYIREISAEEPWEEAA